MAGSGPEAGVDLWSKLIGESKALLENKYEGDLDGPRVHIISSPVLGMSMELEKNDLAVWPELERVFDELAEKVDYIAIACNTLNYYEHQIKAKPRKATFISVSDVVTSYLKEHNATSIALLGASPVTQLDDWSVYSSLCDHFDVEIPEDISQLHRLIYDVKRYGGTQPAIIEQFEQLVSGLRSKIVLLACTELPLIPIIMPEHNVVDVTQLLARELIARTYCHEASQA
ncbi:aspartate/glutamate racemase family protein [Kiloniella sp.]|uniref:aspartate/glutamate racemase family protein n=1 Tax=Kiloniella sp. TaxID=1938587 RepID=UPI003B012B54